MHFTIDTEQHIGRRREQQDAVRVRADLPGFPEGALLAVVCDGMGGLQGGAEASVLAADAFTTSFGRVRHAEPVVEVLHRSLAEAGRVVYGAARGRGVEGDMGTTLVATVVEGDRLHWLSVGDSRIYLARAGRILQLNTEHNLAARLREAVRNGTLTAEEAEAHPQRHALTSFLGTARLDEIDGGVEPLTLEAGDRVVLCSDGLHGVLSDPEIAAQLAAAPRGREANALVSAALARARPNQDNVSACVITVEAAPEADPVTRPPAAPLPAPRPADAGWKPLSMLGLVLLLGAAAVYFVLREGPSSPVVPADTLRTVAPESLRSDSLGPDSAAALPAPGDTVRLRPGQNPPDTLPRPLRGDSLRPAPRPAASV